MVLLYSLVALNACGLCGVPDPSEGLAQANYMRRLRGLPPRIQRLALATDGLDKSELGKLIRDRLGKPTHITESPPTYNSDYHAEEWDWPDGRLINYISGGSLTFMPPSRPSVNLLRDRSRVGEFVVSGHDMVTRSVGAVDDCVGKLWLDADGTYSFVRSQAAGQKSTFFLKHDEGRYSVTYSPGVSALSQYESFTKHQLLAILRFRPYRSKSVFKMTVVYDPDPRFSGLFPPADSPFQFWHYGSSKRQRG